MNHLLLWDKEYKNIEVLSKLKSVNLPFIESKFKINYDELSLKTIIEGLSLRVQDMIRLRSPSNLKLAMSHMKKKIA